MKQIKTIFKSMNPNAKCTQEAQDFDHQVNAALAEGWVLVKREVLQPIDTQQYLFRRVLYAELEREVITEAMRCCDNCKWCEQQPESEPCFSCEGDMINPTNWEEA